MQVCPLKLPKHDHTLPPDEGPLYCLRRNLHQGDHVCLLANGKYIRWLPYEGSFLFEYISEQEVVRLIMTL